MSCDALLEKSIRIYQEIGLLYQSMSNELSNTSISNAHTTIEKVEILLRDAGTLDSFIAEALNTVESPAGSTTDLLATRYRVIADISTANKQIACRAENSKSLLRHEIAATARNRNAIKCYKPVENGRTSIIRNYF